jgi:osmotically inducible lipoprotein OsmB
MSRIAAAHLKASNPQQSAIFCASCPNRNRIFITRVSCLTKEMEPNMRTTVMMGFAAALLVAGCGTDPGDRAASGALLGAAGGAAIGAAAGNPALGAAVGAVGGAVVGAATDPCDLNLGDPVWRDHGGRDAYERRCGHPYRDR